MDVRDLRRLMEAMQATGTSDVELEWEATAERPAQRIVLRRAVAASVVVAPPTLTPAAPTPIAAPGPVDAAAPVAPTAAAATPTVAAAPVGTPVIAPIVGTFYAQPSPDAPAFVSVGDRVKAGQVLCIIEAMKLMNEIEADVAGVVAEILVRNEDPVEYGQILMRIVPG
jgi:acetyl-CoA carboxylase biotin carboxyl carrier protein